METSFLSTVILPIGLVIIMLGLGLSLTVADFRRAATARRAVLVALSCQILVMPAICVVLVTAVAAEPTLADGCCSAQRRQRDLRGTVTAADH